MFRYAMGRRLAHRWNTEFKIDKSDYDINKIRTYVLDNFNITASLAAPEEIERLKATNFGKEKLAWHFWSEVLDWPDDLYIAGTWEDERYFHDIADIIQEEFTLKNPLGAVAQSWKKKILSVECSLSLHFRHGDFIYNPRLWHTQSNAILPLDYYYTCIKILQREYKNLTLFVFSNDIQWCKENLRVDIPVEFIEGDDLKEFEELYLMSLCKHNIIANSTFSWWGAWLNHNPDKKVFMPIPASDEAKINYRYSPIRNENSPLDSDKWIRIPFESVYQQIEPNYQPKITVRPYFSILLVVNNDIETIVENLNSILGQDYNFFELIIIDNATIDGSGKICREVAKAYDNVTLIKLHGKNSNGAAWNIALKAAQGYYVLFLKINDRIFPDALTSLYMANEKLLADIVNSTSYIKEDTGGNIRLADKNFILEKTSMFQNFQDVFFLGKLDKPTFLKFLAKDEVFSPLGTRIFKRDFLLEHGIDFKEKIGDDAEILFTLDAIFQTNEIIFTPNTFYIAPSDKA